MVTRTLAAGKPSAGSDTLLRRALIANMLFSSVASVVLIAGSGWISDFTGLTPAWLPAAIGIGTLLWAVDVGFVARKAELDPRMIRLVIAGDVLWVIVSYGILITGALDLTTAGKWVVGILAEIVALYAVVQYLGLRRLRVWDQG